MQKLEQYKGGGQVILGDPGAVSPVGRKGRTKVFKYVLENFLPPFLPTRLTAPGSSRMAAEKKRANTEKLAKGLSRAGFGRCPPDQADAEKMRAFYGNEQGPGRTLLLFPPMTFTEHR